MQRLMISVSGIRGIIGSGLSPDIVSRYAAAFGAFCGRGNIVVGRDTRTTGQMMEHAVFAGLNASGCSVLSLGVSATPTVQLAVEAMNADGGIVITASHNPAEWNALKFINSRGVFLDENEAAEFLKLTDTPEKLYVDYAETGIVTQTDGFDKQHIQKILSSQFIDPDSIRRKNFSVVTDCVNGAGSHILPALLRELGCDVIEINCEGNGQFVRGPEPVPENLGMLREAVILHKASAGFACDPDADRLAVVDDNGNPLGEEYTLVLAVKQVLSAKSGAVAANMSTTAAIDDVAGMFDVPVFRSKVGEIHVVKEMIKHGCVIGGEGNGGVILPEIHYGRDAMAGAALILQHMAGTGLALGEIRQKLPQYYISKQKISLDPDAPEDILDRIKTQQAGCRIDETDGLKFIFPDHWVHLRKSNTEPVIRIIAEAGSPERAEEIARNFTRLF